MTNTKFGRVDADSAACSELVGQRPAITRQAITGKHVIDATGHVVAPGFIDLHAHGQNIGDYRMQAMQGVTTMLELESGVLPIGQWYQKQAQKALPIN